MGEMGISKRFVAIVPELASTKNFNEKIGLDWPLICCSKQRPRARLIIKRKQKYATFIPREFRDGLRRL